VSKLVVCHISFKNAPNYHVQQTSQKSQVKSHKSQVKSHKTQVNRAGLCFHRFVLGDWCTNNITIYIIYFAELTKQQNCIQCGHTTWLFGYGAHRLSSDSGMIFIHDLFITQPILIRVSEIIPAFYGTCISENPWMVFEKIRVQFCFIAGGPGERYTLICLASCIFCHYFIEKYMLNRIDLQCPVYQVNAVMS
jgi:hypothetical protein